MRGKHIAAATLAMIVAGPTAVAEERECSVEFRSIVDVARVEKVISSRKQDRGPYEQVFNLKNGITASFEITGCNEYLYSFSFRPVKGLTAEASPEALIKAARTLLESVPIKKADDWYVSEVRDTLRRPDLVKDTTPGDNGIEFECGTTLCTISVPKPGILDIEVFQGGLS